MKEKTKELITPPDENVKESYFGFSQEEIKDIRHMIDPSHLLSWSQIKLFLYQCQHTKLDPRLKQIYAIPRWNQNSNRYELTTVTSIDGFRAIAERTGKYAPGRPTEFTYDEEGKLISATAYVKKLTSDGTWHEIGETAFVNEYKPTDPKKAFFWNKMEHVMTAKAAEVRAIKRAAPQDTCSLAGTEEMIQDIEETQKTKEEYVQGEISDIPEIEEIKEPSFEVNTQEIAELLTYLENNHDLRQNILSYMVKEYGLNDLKEMPKELFDKVILKAKAQYQPVLFGEEQQQAMGV